MANTKLDRIERDIEKTRAKIMYCPKSLNSSNQSLMYASRQMYLNHTSNSMQIFQISIFNISPTF